MQKYQRNENRSARALALDETFDFLMEAKYKEIECCTNYQKAKRDNKISTAHYWFKTWQDTTTALYNQNRTEHVCTCFHNHFCIVDKKFPLFVEEIWSF